MIDDINNKILNILQMNSKTTNAEIARQVNMAPSAVLERIRKLESRDIIKKYTVQINPVEVGKGLLAFIQVKANGPVVDMKVAKQISKISEVQEVHLIAGEDSYLVKVRIENPEALTKLLRNKFAAIKSIRTTNTTIVLETIKETNELVF